MTRNNASMGRPAEESKKAGVPYEYSLLPGHLAVIFGMLALAGCTSTPPTPPTPVRVKVPVMVPCIGAVPARPAYEFDKVPATATDGEIILALARDWPHGREYEGKLEAIIEGCLGVANLFSVQGLDLPSRPPPKAP